MACFRVMGCDQLGEAIHLQVERIALQSHQLLILAGVTLEQLSSLSLIKRLELSEVLCEKLLPVAHSRRADEVEVAIEELLELNNDELLLLDRIQILFEPTLQLDVLRCLKTLSKKRPLIINWPGTYNGETLSFSVPGKPDYFYYDETDLSSVPVLWVTGNGEQK